MWRARHNIFQNWNIWSWIWRNNNEPTHNPPVPFALWADGDGSEIIDSDGYLIYD